MLDDVKLVAVIGRRALTVSKPDYPGLNRVIEPLVPNKQPFGKLFMENGRMRSAIDVIAVNPQWGRKSRLRCPAKRCRLLPAPRVSRERFAVRLTRAGHKQRTGHDSSARRQR